MGSPGTVSPTTADLPDFIKARDIFAGGATPARDSRGHVFPATGPNVELVDLFNINFLGKRFAENKYREVQPNGEKVERSARGVSSDMAKRLIKAQEEIYRLFLARRALAIDEVDFDPTKPPTEKEFDAFCGIKALHGGFSFRRGKHSLGCAIDIDVTQNPYIATRTRNGAVDVFGGEQGGFSKDKIPLLQTNIWKPAVEVYDRAAFILFGSESGIKAVADVAHFRKGASSTESFDEAWFRFLKASRALEFYFALAFNKVPAANQGSLTTADPHNQGVPFEVFKERFISVFGNKEKAKPTHPEIEAAMLADEDGFLQRTHQEIIADHALVRKAMVTGSLTVAKVQNNEAFANAVANVSRDPCHGFMTHRKETVRGMCSSGIGGLRWGACMFGEAANGDIMHFDMGEGFRPTGITTETVPAGTSFEKIGG